MPSITSKQNPKIKWIRALLSQRQERETSNAFVIEGVRLIEEAHNSGLVPEIILHSSKISTRGTRLLDAYKTKLAEIHEVNHELLRSISDTENPQGLLAVFNKKPLPIDKNSDFILIADGIHDPGNLGTMLRTALAAKVNALILTPGSVDVYSPKVLRAAMGAHFRLPVHIFEWDQIVSKFASNTNIPLTYYLAAIENGVKYWEPDFKNPTAIIIGSEANGASIWAHQISNKFLSIPISKYSESLNASIAAGIILFEIVRQRSL